MRKPPVCCEAVFDRLGPALLAQAYQLLVPKRRGHGHHRAVSLERTPAMPTAAIYARVSSARQKEQQTIQSQTAALPAHAAEQGLDVPPEWVFQDEGYSGATLYRPALERLRDLVRQVPVEVVLCYAPDRLARKYAYQALLVEELARAGTEVRFLNGPQGDRPEDALLTQFQGMIAEYEHYAARGVMLVMPSVRLCRAAA